ncbi:MAG: YtxH domain-containing protein [Proteobacteria bacterium]|nr:YtxH domain-containing protein [Pseudomonadota bacterium]MBU1738525.1 YtxH domain-containing protein [Pseudomonadota bacterium]
MARDDCGSGSLTTFLTGALFGAAAALLLAPRTGKETRELLVDYGNTIRENIPEELKAAAISRGREMIEQGKKLIDHGNDILSDSQEYLDEKKHALNSAIEAGKEAMQKEKEALAATLADKE